MPQDVWTPMITSDHSLRNKSLEGRNKVAHVELLQGLATPVPRYAVSVIYRKQQLKKQKRFSVFQKNKSKTKKSLFLIKYWMRYTINIPPNTKDLTINQTMVAYGNRQKRNSVRASKQLICCDHCNI